MEISACIHICVSFPLLRNFCWDDLTWDQRGSMSHFVCKQDLTRFHSWQRTPHFYQSRSWNIRSLWSHPCFFISSAWMLSLCSSNIFLVSPVGDQTSPLCLCSPVFFSGSSLSSVISLWLLKPGILCLWHVEFSLLLHWLLRMRESARCLKCRCCRSHREVTTVYEDTFVVHYH